MNVIDLTLTSEAQKGFYPTPKALADKLFDLADLQGVTTVLEPSAGKGDLIKALAYYMNNLTEKRYGIKSDYKKISFDAIEIDPNLRAILTHEFSEAKVGELEAECAELDEYREHTWNKTDTTGLTEGQTAKWNHLQNEIRLREKWTDVKIVHNDFMTYRTEKVYNLILMNPPFANGCEHLLHAINIQKVNGGKILCILNAETVLNLYSNNRRQLMNTLHELNAKIVFEDNAFSDAERETDVRVALIYVDIPEPEHYSTIYESFKKSHEIVEDAANQSEKLTVNDFLGDLIAQYNEELELGFALIDEYKALYPYLNRHITDRDRVGNSLKLQIGTNDVIGIPMPKNEFAMSVRRKYWLSLLDNKDFTGMLTENLNSQYRGMLEDFSKYDFTMFNIQKLLTDMSQNLTKGIEDTILDLFNKFTQKFAWIPEMDKNVHYYNGWKTNKAMYLNKRVIIPCNGQFSDKRWGKQTLNIYNVTALLSDVQKALNYIDGGETDDISLNVALTKASDEENYKKVNTKYFYATFYKKGTIHLEFKSERLLEKFNIFVGRIQHYLPPSYGKKSYDAMTDEEKRVIDEFQGKESYQRIMQNPNYYLCSTTNLLKLTQ